VHPAVEGELKEHVKLDLRELTKRALITRGIEDFCSYLARWRRFNENRVFLPDYALPETPV